MKLLFWMNRRFGTLLTIGIYVLTFCFLCLDIMAKEINSESFSSIEFDEMVEDEEKTRWMPESMSLIWDVYNYKYTPRPDHRLNPETGLFTFDEYKAVTSIDLEWNPRISESLDIRTRQALEYTTSDQENDLKGYLLEGYLHWKNKSQDFVIDLGKVKLEWGSGYAWKPTQVLFPDDSNLNSDIESDEGLEMLQLEFVIKGTTNTLLVAKMKDDTDSANDSQRQAAYRISIESQLWEVSLLYHKTSEEVNTMGLSFTGLLSDAMEFHGEWSRTDKRNRLAITKVSDGIQMGPVYLPAQFQYQVENGDQDFDQYLIGTQYTFTNNMNLIVELYHTTHGYDESEWNRIKTGVDEAHIDKAWKNNQFNSVRGNPYAGFLKQTMGLNEIGQLRQNYLFIRWTTGESDNLWEWEQILQLNLDDDSHMSMAKLHKSWSDSTQTEFSYNIFMGDPYSEQGINPYSDLYTLSMSMSF